MDRMGRREFLRRIGALGIGLAAADRLRLNVTANLFGDAIRDYLDPKLRGRLL